LRSRARRGRRTIRAGRSRRLAPAGTPKAVIDKIREDVVRSGNEPAFRKKQFIDRALEPILNTPEEFARFLVEDRAASGRVVKEAGLTPQ
jgi:tripartite-type tricarboxylate transporter receptor subunit TctC